MMNQITAENLPESVVPPPASPRPVKQFGVMLLLILGFSLGILGGYLLWGQPGAQTASADPQDRLAALAEAVNPAEGYMLPIAYGSLGPRLLSAGAIDFDSFVQVYQNARRPLSDEQLSILQEGSQEQIVFNRENAYFLLNFFWALGLTNQNAILTEGPMMSYGPEQVGRFASTGGWTIGAQPTTELYASTPLLILTSEQQARLENVAQNVYRPCCNNPTHFPDCNHGMAMLGMLTLLASEDASEVELYEAAKYANAFWYPQQTYELVLYFNAVDGQEFAKVDPQKVVSSDFSSGAGFGKVHQYLANNGLLEQAPGSGNSCGV